MGILICFLSNIVMRLTFRWDFLFSSQTIAASQVYQQMSESKQRKGGVGSSYFEWILLNIYNISIDY